MNLWRRGSLLVNPYYRTAFRLARVPPEVVAHRTIVQLIGQTRRLIAGDPGAHTVQGQPVTDADVNAAEKVLTDARQRIAEELLEHATELPPLDEIRRLAGEVAVAMAVDGGPLPLVNPACLEPLADALLRLFAATAAGGHPSFGALELDLVPPCGRPEDE